MPSSTPSPMCKKVMFDDSVNGVNISLKLPKRRCKDTWYSGYELAFIQLECKELIKWCFKNGIRNPDWFCEDDSNSLRGLEQYFQGTQRARMRRRIFVEKVRMFAMKKIKLAGFISDMELASFVRTLSKEHVQEGNSRAVKDELAAQQIYSCDDSIEKLYTAKVQHGIRNKGSLSRLAPSLHRLLPKAA